MWAFMALWLFFLQLLETLLFENNKKYKYYDQDFEKGENDSKNF